MEDIIDVYKRPYDPARPVVNMDETLKQLVADVRILIAAKPGHPQRYDVGNTIVVAQPTFSCLLNPWAAGDGSM